MYLVLEIQTMENGQVAHLLTQHADGNQAESKYHTILASAAISNLPKHSAVILDEEGSVFSSQCYKHGESESD